MILLIQFLCNYSGSGWLGIERAVSAYRALSSFVEWHLLNNGGNFFIWSWIQFVIVILEIFCIYVYKEKCSVISFHYWGIWFWYQGNCFIKRIRKHFSVSFCGIILEIMALVVLWRSDRILYWIHFDLGFIYFFLVGVFKLLLWFH